MTVSGKRLALSLDSIRNGGDEMATPLSRDLLRRIDAYPYDNPLVRTPLTLEHVKPRLLGHSPPLGSDESISTTRIGTGAVSAVAREGAGSAVVPSGLTRWQACAAFPVCTRERS